MINESPGNRATKGYMTREKLSPNIHYTNQGHNGWTSGGIADAIGAESSESRRRPTFRAHK